jgi:hypothetical protein
VYETLVQTEVELRQRIVHAYETIRETPEFLHAHTTIFAAEMSTLRRSSTTLLYYFEL